MSDSALAVIGSLLRIEQAALLVAMAGAATAVGTLTITLSLERLLRFFRNGKV